jgi:hypothetical protein
LTTAQENFATLCASISKEWAVQNEDHVLNALCAYRQSYKNFGKNFGNTELFIERPTLYIVAIKYSWLNHRGTDKKAELRCPILLPSATKTTHTVEMFLEINKLKMYVIFYYWGLILIKNGKKLKI